MEIFVATLFLRFDVTKGFVTAQSLNANTKIVPHNYYEHANFVSE
jgi:hypothetical protein